jgi:cell division protein FtsN
VIEGDEEVVQETTKRRVQVASVDRRKSPAKKQSSALTVRLGPYPSRKAAETARNRLAKSGYRGRVVGQTVMVGTYSSRASADKVAKGLRGKGYRPSVVAAR